MITKDVWEEWKYAFYFLFVIAFLSFILIMSIPVFQYYWEMWADYWRV